MVAFAEVAVPAPKFAAVASTAQTIERCWSAIKNHCCGRPSGAAAAPRSTKDTLVHYVKEARGEIGRVGEADTRGKG